MNPKSVIKYIGILLAFIGAFMCLPLGVSIVQGDEDIAAIAWSMVITIGIGYYLFFISKSNNAAHLTHRDGVFIVTVGWLTAGIFGALPFIISGVIPDFTSAFFESVSGFTTTGATVLPDIEGVPSGILMWRSLTQWIGGMGTIILSIAILPFLGIGGMQLYKADIPGPVVDKLKPRMSDTSKTLWKVYLIFTALEIIFLAAGGMSIVDSINHAFCTISTGGFTTKNAGIGSYNNAYFETVIIIFMIIAGINFTLHYRALSHGPSVFWKNPEWRVFLFSIAALTGIVAFDIYGKYYYTLASAIRYASFQASSIITTTGFASAVIKPWPALSRAILFLSVFLGGMAGSTSGGLKTMRVMLLIKQGFQEVLRIVHPHAVTAVKIGGRAVPQEVLNSIWGFFILYIMLFVTASLFMIMLGLDVVSAFSSVAACISNVGPGLGSVGLMDNFTDIPLIGKWVLIFCMLIGRLEIYTVLVLLSPEFWRK